MPISPHSNDSTQLPVSVVMYVKPTGARTAHPG